MKRFQITIFITLILILSPNIIVSQSKPSNETQEVDNYKANSVQTLSYKYVPSIKELIENGTFIAEDPENYLKMGPKRFRKNLPVKPGSTHAMGRDPLVDINKKTKTKQTRDPILDFITTTNTAVPGDPTGEIGRDYYIAAWNSSFRIFNLDGSPATPATSLGNFFTQDIGDPIALYDSEADRYIITSMGSNAVNFAISVSNDPVNDGWHVYNATGGTFNTGGFPDYPKYSIWSDAYYLTINPLNLFALERDKIISGDSSASIQSFNISGAATANFASAQILDIVDDNHPAPGNATLVYLQDDAFNGISFDHIKYWTVNVDWDNPSNSSISNPTILETTPFISVFDGGSFSNLTQPNGVDIDAVAFTIMNQAQFRKFPTHNSAIFNFVVNAAIGGELAAIRWYELRQTADGEPWEIYQEGTYTAPDGRHAFMGSMSMDLQGNIGMGYSSVSTTQPVSLRYTGRYANDPLGEMTLQEGTFDIGTGYSNYDRYADYAHMSVEPSYDKQFWFVGEYFKPGRRHRVGVFQIAADAAYDAGVISVDSPVSGTLTSSEEVTISIFNYGENEISNFDVSFQVDGGSVVTETFSGTIPAAETEQFTFASTVDMSSVGTTYSITSYTSLTDDENADNDSFTADVTHLNANDLGVSEISTPTSGTGLSSSEQVTVIITNYGGASQSNFDISLDIDGTLYTETVAGPIQPNSSLEYTFSQTLDLSEFGVYTLTVFTSLENDYDTTNDSITATINNSNCAPTGDMSFGDGIHLFELAGVSHTSEAGVGNGYDDFTNITFDLEQGETYPLTLSTGYGTQYFRVWIDYNDDYTFTLDELVVDNFLLADGQGAGTYTGTTDFVIPEDAPLGQHLMRAKTNWNAPVPDDACEETQYGATEDYTANIVESLSIQELDMNLSELIIYSSDNKNFVVNLVTSLTDTMRFSVYDTNGKLITNKSIDKSNNTSYVHNLDMGQVSAGVYLVRFGNSISGFKTSKILVK
tara:strand:- start:1920 stop:4877 length:2958 start_codon:yes stop_codon:yes gene_type:complete